MRVTVRRARAHPGRQVPGRPAGADRPRRRGRRQQPPRPGARRHVERCLRCQAELVQYRKLLRALQRLRTEVLDPAPGPGRRHPGGHSRRPASATPSARCSPGGGSPTSVASPPPRPPAPPGRSCCAARSPQGTSSPTSPAGPGGRTGGQPASPAVPGSAYARHAARDPTWSIGGSGGYHRPPSNEPPRAVAQLVEHRSPKPAVGGSSPSCPAQHSFPELQTSRGPLDGRTHEPRTEAPPAAAGRSSTTTGYAEGDASSGTGRARPKEHRTSRRQFVREVNAASCARWPGRPGGDHRTTRSSCSSPSSC